ncbi:cysteine desulfurase family protein [Phytoactinopolyspora halotolerans]|uniref:Cysteine desulfurase n=1 Tax=Phytoactinopolyspora halotolerans TaxID=1981512 RepID=A0A6L9SCQ0_9ACTN|nr:cysteine desulfurase family protein [Phytoactinopolyspora halotolerans]NEE01780.1 cysteine desulfurase [Phytoactinopolyspora halotolerans]
MDPTRTDGAAQSRQGYFDAASTEPLHPAARDVWLAAIDDGWADPARLYGSARRARVLLDNARELVAAVIGSKPDEVSFTSSGTQAVQLGMLGTARARDRSAAGIVASAVEHSSVLHTARHLAMERTGQTGPDVRIVEVDRLGRVDTAAFAAALTPDTALACLQTANHEVGTVQPVEAVADACQARTVPLLVDAAQTVGRQPVPGGWSVLTASAHKWGGPPGVGVLAVGRKTRWRSALPEDEREGGRVPGFENVPGVLAAAAALRARVEEADELARRHRELIDRIRQEVPRRIPDVEVVGAPVDRLAHLVTFSCLYVNGEALVTELDRAGFAVNSGSSCTASTLRPSHVLEAMGVLTHGNVRVSLSRDVSGDDVDRFLDVLPEVVARLRSEAGM